MGKNMAIELRQSVTTLLRKQSLWTRSDVLGDYVSKPVSGFFSKDYFTWQ